MLRLPGATASERRASMHRTDRMSLARTASGVLMKFLMAASVVLASTACWGCSSSSQQPAAQPAALPLCPAHGEGFDIAVQETGRGARVVYKSPKQGSLDALHGELLQRSQPPRARAAGGAPNGAAVPLPPVAVAISREPNQLVVTYEALDLDDVPRLRSLAQWDARAQQAGRCPSLQVQNDPGIHDPSMPEIEPRFWTNTVTGVAVEPAILRACNIVRTSSFVAFDPTDRRIDVYPLLRQLVRCLDDGPLAGKRIRLLSYPEPAASAAALEPFGGSRASALARFLSDYGVDPSRIDIAVARPGQASTDERGWAWYRRVDVQLPVP